MTRKHNQPITYTMPNGDIRTFASVSAMADELGMEYQNAYRGVYKYKRRRNRVIHWPDRDGVMQEWESIAELARHFGVSREAMRLRVKKAENGEKESK